MMDVDLAIIGNSLDQHLRRHPLGRRPDPGSGAKVRIVRIILSLES